MALAQSVEGVLMMIAGGVGTLFGGFVGAAAIIAAARAGDHVLVMSNGGFGGLHGKLLALLGRP